MSARPWSTATAQRASEVEWVLRGEQHRSEGNQQHLEFVFDLVSNLIQLRQGPAKLAARCCSMFVTDPEVPDMGVRMEIRAGRDWIL